MKACNELVKRQTEPFRAFLCAPIKYVAFTPDP